MGNESLPISIICLKHSKTIKIVCLSDILKIFIFEAMQIQFDYVFICRYPMLSRQNMKVLIRFRQNLSVVCIEPLSMCVPNFIRIALTGARGGGGGVRRQRRDELTGAGGTLGGVSSPHSAFSKVAAKSFPVFNRFGPNLVCLLAVPEEDYPPTLKKIRQL